MIKMYAAFSLLCITYLLTSAANASPPTPLTVCVDFHCDEQVDVSLSETQWQRIISIFSKPSKNAEEERDKIRTAIGYFETEVGKLAGTWRDKAANTVEVFEFSEEDYLNTKISDKGQVDCISESRNTTTYLNLLVSHDLLKLHTVSERKLRHKFFIFPHWTAVIQERDSGIKYAVDSWFLDNGYPPYIQELRLWAANKPFK